MPDLDAKFEAAAKDVQTLKRRPDEDALLDLYALYKQAVVGDVQGQRPGFLDVVGRAKFDAWSKLQGMSAAQAKQSYIDRVAQLKREA